MAPYFDHCPATLRREVSMRTAGLGLALAACAQLTLLSSPAFAQDSASGSAAVSASTSTSASPATGTASASGSSSGSSESSAPPTNARKEKNGWIVLGVGGVVAVGGIVLDIIGTQVGNSVPGQSGTTTSTIKTNFYWGGTTMIVAGVLAGIYGGSMIVDARKSDVQPAQAPKDRDEDASATRAMQVALSSAPGVQLPIVSAKF
jgi:hypothetical protein